MNLPLPTALLLLIFSCVPKPDTFRLSGHNLPKELDGSYLYFITQDGGVRDSVLVEDGTFVYLSDQTDTLRLSYLVSPVSFGNLPVVCEPGNFTLERDSAGSYVIVAQNPMSINARFRAYKTRLSQTLDPITADLKVLNDRYTLNKGNSDSLSLIEKEMIRMSDLFASKHEELVRAVYEENRDNVIGLLAFSSMSFPSDSAFMSAYERAGKAVKANVKLLKKYKSIEKAVATSSGKPFSGDFVISDGEGGSLNPADYYGKGKYLLVDFWASWCLPCRVAMPHLSEMSEKYADILNVVSIGVWENAKADNDKAAKEVGISWPHIYDADSLSVKKYGLQGVPTLMLVDPDGTILVRTYNHKDIQKALSEL